MELFETLHGARFSNCRKYRYYLWRIWDVNKPCIMFIGLNPSTADETKDDPTIRRVIGFANDWGYGGIYMANLFAMVSPYPEDLIIADDPLGENNHWLREISKRCKDVLYAWGNFNVMGRDEEVKKMFPNGVCLGKNKNGSPKHPLYIAKNTKPIPY